ncbi:unnamed protein product, partial [Rotaria sp. Silwood1]
KYWSNPQYLIQLEYIDGNVEEKWCTMIIALMFKDERQRMLSGEEPVLIAFDVCKVKNDADIRTHIEEHQKFYMTHLDYVGSSGKYTPYRSVSQRFKVRPGTYIIIPNTFECDTGGEYFLRIFTEKEVVQTVTVELTINKKNLTESEIKHPHINVNSEVDSKPASTPESSDGETNKATEDIGGAFPGSNPTKPTINIDVDKIEGHCTIQ